MRYASAAGFRRALEDRLKARAAGDGARIARDRKRIAFDRLLARLVDVAPGQWVLKGGFALDMRLADRARTTKDIDLAWQEPEDELLDTLISAATRDLGDFFAFSVERTDDPPDQLGGANRFHVTASLAGRVFEAFGPDIGHDDLPASGAETLTTPNLLGFAGIEPVAVPAMPLDVQVAEKLHAEALHRAIAVTFANRATHGQPRSLPPAPEQWQTPFRQLARSVGVDDELDAGHAAAAAMLDPVLQHHVTSGVWAPDSQRWGR